MRGSPLLRAALMLLGLLVLLVPLRSLTMAPTGSTRAVPPKSALPPTKVHLEILSTAAPFVFSVSHLGKVVWQGESPNRSVQTDLAVPFPREGIDLELETKWAPNQAAAVKFTVDRAGYEPIAQTVWGDGGVSEVLTFK